MKSKPCSQREARSSPIHTVRPPELTSLAAETRDRPRVFALPGVPAEMFEMWEQTVLARIQQIPGVVRKVIVHRRLKCFGVGESTCEEMLPDLIRRGRTPAVGITVHRGTITLRITAEGESEEACHQIIQPTSDTIRNCLGNLVFGEEDDELQHAVQRILESRNERIAICEWGTGGLIQEWLGALQQHACFRGGLTVTSAAGAANALSVPIEIAEQVHSQELACRLAQGIRQRFDVEYGVAVSGFPQDHTSEYHVALATPTTVVSRARSLQTHPDIRRDIAAKTALNLLRLNLLT